MAIPRAFASLSLALLLVASPLCCMGKFILYSGDTLRTGEALTIAAYSLIMQADCNLVQYDNGSPTWASNTGGLARNCYCILQKDGNLVVYTTANRPLWASNTNRGPGNYVLVQQPDRNAVIYGGSLWATNTNRDSLTGGMYIESKATIFGTLPAASNLTTTDAKPAQNIAMVINK